MCIWQFMQVHPTTKQHQLLANAFLEYAGKLFHWVDCGAIIYLVFESSQKDVLGSVSVKVWRMSPHNIKHKYDMKALESVPPCACASMITQHMYATSICWHGSQACWHVYAWSLNDVFTHWCLHTCVFALTCPNAMQIAIYISSLYRVEVQLAACQAICSFARKDALLPRIREAVNRQ
jgi:hypothetical protein